MFDDLLVAVPAVFTLSNLLFAVAGIWLGFIFGAIPGIGGNTAIGLLIPFTFYLDPMVGIVALLAIGKGTSFGGSVPAVLLNMPGTSQAAMTAIDGHQATKKGKSKKALHTALYASVGGDLLSDVVLLLCAPPLAAIALSVGPPEYAAIILFALMIIGALVGSSPVKGLISAALGLLLATVGRDIFSGQTRFTFGFAELEEGIALVPLLLGLMVVSEIFIQLRRELLWPSHGLETKALDPGEKGLAWSEFKGLVPTILRSGGIGTVIGAIPGLGATVGAVLAYNTTKRLAKPQYEVGRGGLRGVAAAEAGNSAGTGANLIPLVTLGIPGNVEAALILGAFMIHGLTPGPFLMQEQGPLVYAIILSLILANLLLLVMGLGFLKVARYILLVPTRLLLPVILVVTTVGTYAVSRSLFDVGLMLVFGIFGYFMRRLGFSPIPMVIAFLLSGLLENGVRRALILSGNDPAVFVGSPISILFVGLSVLSLIAFTYRSLRRPVSDA